MVLLQDYTWCVGLTAPPGRLLIVPNPGHIFRHFTERCDDVMSRRGWNLGNFFISLSWH